MKPFPLFNEMAALVEGQHASGEHAFCIPEMTTDDDLENHTENGMLTESGNAILIRCSSCVTGAEPLEA